VRASGGAEAILPSAVVKEQAMQSESRQAHWEGVYTQKGENEVSWFQESPAPSLDLIVQVGATPASAIIDIGGGASRLVDNLVDGGFEDIAVLDLSDAALQGPPWGPWLRDSLDCRGCYGLGTVADVRRLARPGRLSFPD
jgi:hypothetical protein